LFVNFLLQKTSPPGVFFVLIQQQKSSVLAIMWHTGVIKRDFIITHGPLDQYRSFYHALKTPSPGFTDYGFSPFHCNLWQYLCVYLLLNHKHFFSLSPFSVYNFFFIVAYNEEEFKKHE